MLRAICLVYGRWIDENRKPGSDMILQSTRIHRPALVAEVQAEWERIVESDHDADSFPYHESYVIKKWIQFRKMNDGMKAGYIAEARALDA